MDVNLQKLVLVSLPSKGETVLNKRLRKTIQSHFQQQKMNNMYKVHNMFWS